jgi:hypothetical protein
MAPTLQKPTKRFTEGEASDESIDALREEANRFDGPSANTWRDARPDEQEAILRAAAETRRNAFDQELDSTRSPTLEEEFEIGSIRTAHGIGQPLPEFLSATTSPVRWFGPVVDGGLVAFVGAPETFKTMAALTLGMAGAAGGGRWLGLELGRARPFVYVSAEKARATVQDRLARMCMAVEPMAPIRIVHRAGVTFGGPSWQRVVELVEGYGRGTFVVLDTVASLAGPAFDENSGRDMAAVLASLRKLVDAGATCAVLHHPSKHGDGTGGARLRGHSSLWGEVDAVVEFTRANRAVDAGLARIEPKDGDAMLVHFRWDRETFLVEVDAGGAALTETSLAEVIAGLYGGTPVKAGRIHAEFPRYGRSAFLGRLKAAVEHGLVARVGGGNAAAYIPVGQAGGGE